MAKKQQVEVVEDDEDEEVELEELEVEDDEEEVPQPPKKKKAAATAAEPAKKKVAKKAEPELWGVRQLMDLIKAKYDKEYGPREVRTLLRKLAREGKLEREIIPGNKVRWGWTGPDDPEVALILKSVKGGSIEAAKKAALDKMKNDKAARDAAAAKTVDKAKKKKTPVVVEEEDDEDDD